MNKLWKVIQWEVMRNLLNKQFIIGLLITPLIIVLFAGVPRLLERLDRPEISRYYILDELGIAENLRENIPADLIILEDYHGEMEQIEDHIRKEKFNGFFVLEEDFWETGVLKMFFRERSYQAERTIRSILSGMLQEKRMLELEVDQDQVAYLTSPANLEMVPLEEAIVPQTNEIIVSIAFMSLIYFLIFSSGTMLMQSSSQERRDRMAEIILSSIKPVQLMQGKIIGHFLLGMIQLLFWIALSLPVIVYVLDFPVMQAIMETNMIVVVMFGLLGYLLFSSLFVGMGATMEDLQSAGNSQGLVIMIPMISFLFISPAANNPNGLIARIAGFFPVTSPVIMIMRNAVTKVPAWEIILSILILAASVLIIMRLAGKVFRIGMLMYGKTASFGEIVKWLKYRD